MLGELNNSFHELCKFGASCNVLVHLSCYSNTIVEVAYKQIISHSSEARKSKIKLQAGNSVWWGPASRFINSHLFTVFTWWKGVSISKISFLRALIPFMRPLLLWYSLHVLATPSDTITLSIRFQHEFWGVHIVAHSLWLEASTEQMVAFVIIILFWALLQYSL